MGKWSGLFVLRRSSSYLVLAQFENLGAIHWQNPQSDCYTDGWTRIHVIPHCDRPHSFFDESVMIRDIKGAVLVVLVLPDQAGSRSRDLRWSQVGAHRRVYLDPHFEVDDEKSNSQYIGSN